MKRNYSENSKNKYLIPTIVVALLLVLALSLLLVVIFGEHKSTSVSGGNVIGPQTVSVETETTARVRGIGGVLSVNPLTALQNPSNEKLSLSWINGYENDEKFSVSNMFPGDTASKEYTLSIKTYKAKALHFDLEITNNSLLSKVLLLKVEFEGETLYEGLLKDMPQLSHDVTGKTSVPCKLTVKMPTHDKDGKPVDNNYARLSLTADFKWSLEENPGGGGGGGGGFFDPAAFQSTLVGKKVLEGREWQEGDSFTFELQYKVRDEEYTKLGEKTITSPEQYIDFTKEFNDFSFRAAALYDFRIIEVEGDLEGVEYDSTPKSIQIIITGDKITSPLKVLSVTGDNVQVNYNEETLTHHISFEFKNVYTAPPIDDPDDPDDPPVGPPDDPDDPDDPDKPDDPVVIEDIELTIPVKNTVDSETAPPNDEEKEYMFVLENVDTGDKKIIRIEKDDNGIGEFKLEYTKDDIGKTFNYKIYAFDEGLAGVEYSDKVYELKIGVLLNEEAKTLYVQAWLDGVPVAPEDIQLEFTTVETYTEDDIDTIFHLSFIHLIAILAEIAWLWFVFYSKKKAEKKKEEKNTVTLNSWSAPILFFSMFVPKWEVVLFVATLFIAVVMLVVDIVIHIKFFPKKKKDEQQDEQKEVDNEE